jgi:hypothetical protein
MLMNGITENAGTHWLAEKYRLGRIEVIQLGRIVFKSVERLAIRLSIVVVDIKLVDE